MLRVPWGARSGDARERKGAVQQIGARGTAGPVDAPLRVLHINSTLIRRAGVMSVVMNYFRHVDRSRVVFDFFSYKKIFGKSYQEEIVSLGGRCFPSDADQNVLRIRSALSRLLQDSPGVYRVAHLHHPAMARFLYPVLRRHGVGSVIVHSHSTAYSDSRLKGIRNRLLCRSMGRYSDVRLACSTAAGDFLFGPGHFDVLPNAIELDTYAFDSRTRASMREGLGLGESLVVGHVGRFSEEKNHHLVIAVFAELLRLDRDCHLLLVGDGQLRQTIEAMVVEQGLQDHVTFLGERRDVPDLYQAMDVLILPSFFEGLPMVGVEAQCAGLPIVCSDRVPKEVAIGSSVFLPLDLEPRRWAECIRGISVEAGSSSQRERGVKMAREKGFDVALEADRLMRRYESLARK